MIIDIPYYIRQCLREQREVSLPGVGTLSLVQKPAQIQANKSKITPPSLSIQFTDKESDNTALKEYIEDTGLYNDANIDDAIESYAQDVFDKVLNDVPCEVRGLGFFERNIVFNTVYFKPSNDSFTDEYKGLGTLSIAPVKRIKNTISVDHVVETEPVLNKEIVKPTPWWYPVLAGIILASLFIGWLKNCGHQSWDTLLYDTEPVEETAPAIIPKSDDIKLMEESKQDSIMDSKYKEVDSMLGNDRESQLSSSEVTKVLKSGVPSIFGSRAKEANRNELQIERACTIVLGAFQNQNNIDEMIKVVESMGWKLHVSDYESYTRVGFTFDSTGVDLEAFITDVRRRVSLEAWYLNPDLYVAYR